MSEHYKPKMADYNFHHTQTGRYSQQAPPTNDYTEGEFVEEEQHSHEAFGCPFCAHDATQILNGNLDRDVWACVRCTNCFAQGPRVITPRANTETAKFTAVERWNEQATVRSSRDKTKKMELILRAMIGETDVAQLENLRVSARATLELK